ncbi:hypothetical protein NE619_16735 [Anaerovorax odorimutans]|uniref:Carbohydrate-binding domain-containing protein n=1 Tax=Anaerovorax odorimutans TaxID=109327 RepID=A0ABT1RT75_9FIRM|nr:hypothetical protein [Anaerovorax odorimutans]MCQ4638378.1 hypothetical protein [Anaerovorax odorimutans]
MGTFKKTIAVFSAFLLLTLLAACSSKDDEAYGKITEISDTEITIETGAYEPPAKPEGESGSAPAGESPSQEKEQGGAPPQGMGGFTSDGGSKTYILSDNIDITNLKEGVLVKLTLNEDTVTAIETIQQPDGGPAGGADSETGTAKASAAYTVSGGKQNSENKDYESEDANVSAVLVQNKGSLTLTGGTLTKSGDTTDDDESNFYGLNAILAASGGSNVSLDGTTLTSSADGSNAIFATGKGSKVTAKDFTIYTTGDSSRGLDATYKGTIVASGGNITTKGSHCAPIATDRGEGTIQVSDTSVSAEGDGSPCIYSTGDITATNVTGNATGSQIVVVEGKNSITLKDCILQGAGKNGIMLYQSTSGDAAPGQAILNATDSTLTTTSEGPMFYVTNTDAAATLENTKLYYSSDILVNAAGNNTNNWGKEGENGGNFTLTGVSQKFEGNIKCDKISTVALNLTEKTSFKGAINSADTAKSASISLDKSSTWTVTGDSYVTAITNKDAACNNIKSKGFTVYYDKDNNANKWLNGKTLSLSGGGKLTPAA